MTDNFDPQDDPIPQLPDFDLDADLDASASNEDEADFVEAVFIPRSGPGRANEQRERYDLGWLFLCWAWEAGYRNWDEGVRTLARALRGLERVGFIERRTIRRTGRPTHHGFVLTEDGKEALQALSGNWIDPGRKRSGHAE